MAINVIIVAWYYTGDQEWRQQDWDQYKFVKAVKEQTINHAYPVDTQAYHW
jgi:hypothetical protein